MARRRAMMSRKAGTVERYWLIRDGVIINPNYGSIRAELIQNQGSIQLIGNAVNVKTFLYWDLPKGYNTLVIKAFDINSYSGSNPDRPAIFVKDTIPIPQTFGFSYAEKLPTLETEMFEKVLSYDDTGMNYFGILISGYGSTKGRVSIIDFYLE